MTEPHDAIVEQTDWEGDWKPNLRIGHPIKTPDTFLRRLIGIPCDLLFALADFEDDTVDGLRSI